ncbi:unnamed protein product [Chrysoparadoxa australica]
MLTLFRWVWALGSIPFLSLTVAFALSTPLQPIHYFCTKNAAGIGTCAVEVKESDGNDMHRSFVFSSDTGEKVHARIRELSFGEGGFGATVWGSAISMASWVVQNRAMFAGKSCLELGAGCGLTGLACKLAAPSCQVTLSDFSAEDDEERFSRNTVAPLEALSNLVYNTGLNNLRLSEESGLLVRRLDWHDCVDKGAADQAPKPRQRRFPDLDPSTQFDILLAAECVYHDNDIVPLSSTLARHLKPGGTCYFLSKRDRNGLDNFLETLGNADGELATENIEFKGYTKEELCFFIYTAPPHRQKVDNKAIKWCWCSCLLFHAP